MIRTSTALIAAALLAALLPLPAASAAPAADDETAGRMMLVLDSSGSMKEKAAGGQTKIAAARQALAQVVKGLPAEQEVGLRVYGAKVFSASDKGACTDSQRVVDLDTANRDELTRAIKAYKPYGETPTGYALQQAGKDLGQDGRRTIVLVSDGESTCDPDPCAAAAELAEDGIDLRIDVVGLDVSGKAREQLKCVARSGHGTYYDADSAAELAQSLTTTRIRASRPFDLTGTPVKGAPVATEAPTLETGAYLDSFGTGDGLWYKVERTVANSTFHVGVTHRSVGTGNSGDKAYVGIYAGPDEDRCAYRTSFARGNIAYTAASSWRPSPNACNTAKTLWVNVKQVSTRRDFSAEPVEIVVYEEPPLADPSGADLPPKPATPTWSTLTPASSPQVGVVPGTSISSAPVVSDGTYALDINPGETQVVAVPLDWGQNVQAQIDGKLTAAHHESTFDAPWVQVLGPVREAVDSDEYGTDTTPGDWTSRFSSLPDDLNTYRSGSQSYTVAYRNRAEAEAHLSGSGTAGLRYVQISYGADNEVPLAYSLTLRTNGTAGEGAPTYDEVQGLTAPTADSPLVTGTGAVSDAAKPASSSKAATKPAKDDEDGLPVAPIGLGVVGVGLLVGALVVLRRSRSAS
ncbi:VWA domain-containing protein [Aeromicrobium sp. SMF47]|uniref:vWA domain-containing protein n=1 Tax=Aeromicrobium yanjiei TaxID=2662028 RepID=UPI00129E4080|nr:VWA domain-containing protein [Aeromicrobium yanjiei]MRJ75008.1 VWA domain-containing protein [Aeromicrobium yanjiei]